MDITNYNTKHERHLNSYIHSVINLLKQHNKPLTFEEIRMSINIDLLNNYNLLQSIKKNERIICENNTLLYKHAYGIKNIEELQDLLKSVNNKEGIEIDLLKDSPVNIEGLIEILKLKNQVIVLKDNDNSEIVFYNDTFVDPMEDDIKELWNQVRIPGYQDLIAQLNEAGLKKDKVSKVRRQVVIKKEKSKRYKRRIKITNTHVKGLDLSGMNDSD